MPSDTETLFDRLGGAVGVASIVKEMYQRVIDDPEHEALGRLAIYKDRITGEVNFDG